MIRSLFPGLQQSASEPEQTQGPAPPLKPEYTPEQARQLVKHCDKLYESARKAQPTENLTKFNKYYLGKFDGSKGLSNNMNIIKPIVETVSTLILDAQVETSVEPKIFSFSNLNQIKMINDIADILDDCLDSVKEQNKFNILKQKWVRSGCITSIGVAAVYWDQDMNEGQGDVRIDVIDPSNFFPDPSAGNIQDCNFIIVKKEYSAFTLKKKYPEYIEKIDKILSDDSVGSPTQDYSGKTEQNAKALISARTGDNTSTQFYSWGTNGLNNVNKNITVFECYFKDDSTFIPNEQDSGTSKDFKIEQLFKYPNGRMVMYAKPNVIFEDKPIDYPFGFPFSVYSLIDTNNLYGQGIVEPLIQPQNLINFSYTRSQECIKNFISCLVFDPKSGIDQSLNIKNQFALYGSPGCNNFPVAQLVSNNTMENLKVLQEYITQIKETCYETSRINQTMISGERQTGTSSGDMVDALNESPLTSIRAYQRSFEDFLTDLSQKAVTLIQLYYNTPRIIRLSEGKRFAYIRNRSANSEGQIDIINPELPNEVEEIKSDLSLGKYEVKVTSGSRLPRSSAANAQLVMSFAQQGLLGDPNSIETAEMILDATDFPNWRAIIEQRKAMQQQALEESQRNPHPPPGIIDKVSVDYKDLPLDAQAQLIQKALNIQFGSGILMDGSNPLSGTPATNKPNEVMITKSTDQSSDSSSDSSKSDSGKAKKESESPKSNKSNKNSKSDKSTSKEEVKIKKYN